MTSTFSQNIKETLVTETFNKSLPIILTVVGLCDNVSQRGVDLERLSATATLLDEQPSFTKTTFFRALPENFIRRAMLHSFSGR